MKVQPTWKSLRLDCRISSWQQHGSKHWRYPSYPCCIDWCQVWLVKTRLEATWLAEHLWGPAKARLVWSAFLIVTFFAMSHESNFIIKALAQKPWTFVASSAACQFWQRHRLDLNSNDSHLDRETSVAIDHSWLSCRQIQYGTEKVKYLVYQELSETFTLMFSLPCPQCLSSKQIVSAHCSEAVTLHVWISVVIMNVCYLPTFLKSRFVT